MSNIKEKAKNYWEKNKVKLIVSGVAITAIGIGAAVCRAYCKGFIDGGFVGAHLQMDWLDKTFPEESHARELFERHAQEHPEKLVHRKIMI